MLVLTRKATQEIRIGNEIIVRVLGVRGTSVRLGIEAPRSVRVLRQELEAKEASASSEARPIDEVEPTSAELSGEDSTTAEASRGDPESEKRCASRPTAEPCPWQATREPLPCQNDAPRIAASMIPTTDVVLNRAHGSNARSEPGSRLTTLGRLVTRVKRTHRTPAVSRES